jgi:hypothetical protein
MRIKSIFLGVMAFAMTTVFLSAQEEGGSVSLTLDFGASAVSVNNDGDVDSFIDSGFGDDNESTLGVSYESDLFGAVASLGFVSNPWIYADEELSEMAGGPPLAIDELYAWVKPFGEHFKFTGGIFSNTDGVPDYTDDIDNFDIGVFYDGSESGGYYTEPVNVMTSPALVNGFLAEAAFGPVTAQFLLAPNFSIDGTTSFYNGFMDTVGLSQLPNYSELEDAGGRLFRLGGRIIAEFEDIVTVSALFKTYTIPMDLIKHMTGTFAMMEDPTITDPFDAAPPYPGDSLNNMTFGAYADFTAVENLGIALGYTGFVVGNDDSDAKNLLWNGIDLRATWTGIEGLSISTHNNVSFANGEDWYLMRDKDSSFFTLYNALGATKELTEKFSVNVEAGNIFSKTDAKSAAGDQEIEYENFWASAKLISAVTEHAEFTVGLRVDLEKIKDEDQVTVFSVPVGIKVSF